MEIEKGIVTGHFIAHWGVPSSISPHKIDGFGELAILEFAPRGARLTWRYATNGMSCYEQEKLQGGVCVRTELFACTRSRAPWVKDLLIAIAKYPMDYSTYFTEGDTISVGQPIDRKDSPFTGILLAPPGPVDPQTLGLVGGISEKVLVHQVVGILPSDLLQTRHQNGKKLWAGIVENGEALLDVPRER